MRGVVGRSDWQVFLPDKAASISFVVGKSNTLS